MNPSRPDSPDASWREQTLVLHGDAAAERDSGRSCRDEERAPRDRPAHGRLRCGAERGHRNSPSADRRLPEDGPGRHARDKYIGLQLSLDIPVAWEPDHVL